MKGKRQKKDKNNQWKNKDFLLHVVNRTDNSDLWWYHQSCINSEQYVQICNGVIIQQARTGVLTWWPAGQTWPSALDV